MFTGLGAGWSAGGSSDGSAEITIAPFSFPLYCAKSSTDCAFTYTTGPHTTPFVEGAHAYDAIASGCTDGLMIRPPAAARPQVCAMVQDSRCGFQKPLSAHFCGVQSLPFLSFSEPVSRAPIMS